MDTQENKKKRGFFERFAGRVTKAAGNTSAFIIALFMVVVRAGTGTIFHYSESWQMVINTGTTIITFSMVFLIQKGQNKNCMATQLKLNECHSVDLLNSSFGCSNYRLAF